MGSEGVFLNATRATVKIRSMLLEGTARPDAFLFLPPPTASSLNRTTSNHASLFGRALGGATFGPPRRVEGGSAVGFQHVAVMARVVLTI
jgi:hypothetical protein